MVCGLQTAGVAVEAVMESSGTYGDALRFEFERQGVPVFRVSTHRSHGAAEVYDGVASLHDAKSAHILSRLHKEGLSSRWPLPSEAERVMACAIATMDFYKAERQREINRLEALLARHWPELLEVIELGSATQLALLEQLGGPTQVAAQPERAAEVMQTRSQGLIQAKTVQAVLEGGRRTVGVPLVKAELEMLQALCTRALQTLASYHKARNQVQRLGQTSDTKELSAAVGATTAAVLVHDVGDPRGFASAQAYVKAYGLNLKEKSSGKHKGQLKLTKRGPARARQYLWLAALRFLQHDPIARAYYLAKVQRDGGKKSRAVVALMRKLAKGLHAMARTGEALDSRKLFDTTRLELAPA